MSELPPLERAAFALTSFIELQFPVDQAAAKRRKKMMNKVKKELRQIRDVAGMHASIQQRRMRGLGT